MSVWFTLFKKEFQEQKWKLLSLTSIVLAILIAGMIESRGQDLAGVIAVLFSYLFIAPLYIGMGVCAGEHADRSISFVRALPVPLWKVAVSRITVGFIVITIPLIACWLFNIAGFAILSRIGFDNASLLSSLGFSYQGIPPFLLMSCVGLASVGWCLNLYAWVIVVALNQRSELRAGLLGLATIVLLLLLGLPLSSDLERANPELGLLRGLVIASGPVPWMYWFQILRLSFFNYVIAGCLVQFSVVGGLLYYSIRNYGLRSTIDVDRLPQWNISFPAESERLGPPFGSAWKALFWMQVRHSMPVVIAGLTLLLVMVGIERRATPTNVVLTNLGPFVGSVLAIIIGTGSFVPELEPQLYTFWRSRPISPKHWFRLKYLAGAAIVICCFDIPLTVASNWLNPRESTLVSGVFPVLLHLLIFSMSVLAACAVRHPVYSPILAVCGCLAILFGPDSFEIITSIPVSDNVSFFALWRSYAVSGTTWGEVFIWHFNSVPFPNYWSILLLSSSLILLIICAVTCAASWFIRKDVSLAP